MHKLDWILPLAPHFPQYLVESRSRRSLIEGLVNLQRIACRGIVHCCASSLCWIHIIHLNFMLGLQCFLQRQVTNIMNVRVWGSTRRLLSTWKLISNIVEDFFFHYFDKWKQFFGINPIPSIPFLLCLSTSDFVVSRDRCQKSPTGKVPSFHRVDRYSLISVFPQSNSTNTCHDKIKISNHQLINTTGSSTSRKCQLCNRVSQNAASLNRYSRQVHSYRCQPCDRSFFDENALQQHLRTAKVRNMHSVSISQDAGMPQRSQKWRENVPLQDTQTT